MNVKRVTIKGCGHTATFMFVGDAIEILQELERNGFCPAAGYHVQVDPLVIVYDDAKALLDGVAAVFGTPDPAAVFEAGRALMKPIGRSLDEVRHG